MTRILAIESDQERGAALQRLLSQRLNASVVVAASTEDAIISMAEDTPNLILTSSLITPDEERRLSAHLRRVPHLRHLPVLTVPPLVEAAIAVEKKRFSLWSLLRRRRRPKPQTWPAYNADAVAARVHEALEESRMAQAMRLEEDDSAMQALLLEIDSPPKLLEAPSSVLEMPEEELREYCRGPMKERAPRWTRGDLPWLSSVKLTWGLELRLVNISRSGLLVESNVRLTPGNKTDIQLTGPDRDLIVAARVIRSQASTGGESSLIYQTAAEFEQACDWLIPEVTAPVTDSALHPHDQLGALVARVTQGARLGGHSVDLRTDFEAGVRALVARATSVSSRDRSRSTTAATRCRSTFLRTMGRRQRCSSPSTRPTGLVPRTTR
jgi:hypothetical protein